MFVAQEGFRLYKNDMLSFASLSKRTNHIITFCHISLQQFTLIILVILERLPKNCGLILHASAVKIKNKAVLSTGRSGVGKSTIMKLLPTKYQPLADDSGTKKGKNKTFFTI